MYVGKSIKRREDNKYLTGTGQFVDDVALSENIAHAAYVRSPHPHAKIVSISTERALAMQGVLAVLTGKDWTDSGYGEAESVWPVKDMSGAPSRSVNRPFLAIDRVVRYVGECVAMIVAEDRYVAMDAAEAVDVQYEAHPANTVTAKALEVKQGAPLLRIRRVVFDHRDRVVEFIVGLYRPDQYQYQMSLSRVADGDIRSWLASE